MFVTAAAIAGLAGSVCASPISPRQAAASQGQNVIVEGIATIHEDSARPGIDLVLTGRDNSRLTGFVPQESEAAMADLKNYDGKAVELTGVVQMTGGRPEIRITSPKQLAMAEPE
jgi:DNA/RNA endonuclease YhcR with UshA esterase domain